jgi:predicted phage terminase large subunit-like protein
MAWKGNLPSVNQGSLELEEIDDPSFDEVDREFSRRYHLDFMKRLWVAGEPFVHGNHIDVVCKRIDQAIRDFKEGRSTFLLIKVPFRHSKSTIVSRYLPPKFIGEFPDKEVIIATYTAALAREFSRFARDKVMLSEEYQKIFPNAPLAEKEQSVDVWGIEGREGKVRWVGLGGSITGKGGHLVIIDDFFKGREEANSDLVRDKVWDSICNDLLTRRPDPCIVIILATPWHLDDPFGRIATAMKTDPHFPRFEEMKFPAKDSAYREGYLWLNKFSKEWYDSQFSTLGPFYSSALLQCEPVPRGGSMFRVDKTKKYAVAPDDIAWTRGWDLASTEKSRISPDPDYTVGIKLGVRWIASGVEGQNIPKIYVDDMIRGRWESLQRRNIIRDTAIGDGEINVGVEAFGGYKDCYTEVAEILSGLRVVKKVQLPGDKVSKWATLEAAFAAGNVYIREAPWNQDFLDEMAVAPDGKHDDIPDAMNTAFALHGANVKMVWPSFQLSKMVPLQIEWGKASPYTTLHYGALSLGKDMSLTFVAALWDNRLRKLHVYRCRQWRHSNESEVIDYLIDAMQFKKYRVDKFLGSENMFAAESMERSVARQLNRKIKERNLPEIVSIKEAIHYNFFGAVQEGEELFRTNGMLIDRSCGEVCRQILGWIIKNGKPLQEDWGYCECLCLIISELQRKKEIGERAFKLQDYRPVDKGV